MLQIRHICDRQYMKKQEVSSHDFGAILKLARKIFFAKVQFLLLAFVGKKSLSPCCSQQGRIFQKYSCSSWSIKYITNYSIAQI
jgi:hypothetical protein